MGFDINCIIDVHTYPREYFCPICRNLVDPNEAFKSPCSHLFCKSCLAYIANGNKVCPYDGCLVTQSDSKTLIDSDEVLFENISKVRVRCLYAMSGCKWEGTLADCKSHCASCSFGNSLVTCIRCGIQVLHRQMHDHTWHCLAMLGTLGSVGVPSGSTMSSTTSSTPTVAVSQAATQSGASLPGVQNPPTATSLVLAQNYNQPFTANSQSPVATPITMLDRYQWYQPQYLQSYLPCMEYGTYQQPFQRYLQRPVQMYGQQHYVYSNAVPPLQTQPLMQPHRQTQIQSLPQQIPISQAPQQPLLLSTPQQYHLQPQVEGHVQPQLLPKAQAPPQMQGQGSVPTQALTSNLADPQPSQMLHQLLPQLRTQVQAPPQMQGQGSLPTQAYTPNLANPKPPQMLYQLLPHLRPQAQAPPQMQGQGFVPTQSLAANLANPWPSLQPAYVLPQIHHQVSQANAQSQPPFQAQHHIKSSDQSHVVQSQMQPYVTGSQVPQVLPVDGHQQSLGMRPGVSQQHQVPLPLENVLLNPIQHGQIQEQLASTQHPHHQVTLPTIQPVTISPTHKVPSIMLLSHQQFPTHGQPSNPHSAMRSLEQVVHQQGRPITPQQPLQTQMSPSVLPQWGQYQNSVRGPVIPNQGMHPKSHPVSSGVAPLAHAGSSQYPSTPICADESNARSFSEQAGTIEGTTRSLRELTKCSGQGILKEEEAIGHNETAVKGGDNVAIDATKEKCLQGSMKDPPGGKSSEALVKVEEFSKETGTEEGSVYYASLPKDSQVLVQEQPQSIVGPQVSGLAVTTRTDPLGLMGGPIPIHIGDHVVYLNPGPLPGHGHACEMGNVPSLCFTESVGADSQSFAHSGGPTTQIFPGFINAKSSAGGMDSDDSNKRKSFGSAWCRICEVDCNSIEGLQLHSQSNEHHNMAMDKVKAFNPKDEKLQETGDNA